MKMIQGGVQGGQKAGNWRAGGCGYKVRRG